MGVAGWWGFLLFLDKYIFCYLNGPHQQYIQVDIILNYTFGCWTSGKCLYLDKKHTHTFLARGLPAPERWILAGLLEVQNGNVVKYDALLDNIILLVGSTNATTYVFLMENLKSPSSCKPRLMVMRDDHIWWASMMTIYEHYIWSSYMMIIIYDDHHIWWYTMIMRDHQDRTLRAGSPNTKHNTTPEPNTEYNITGPKHQTPSTPEHNAEHIQKPNTEQNNEHGHVFSEQQPRLIARPDENTPLGCCNNSRQLCLSA